MDWKLDVVEKNSNACNRRCILAIPLSWRAQSDELTWAYSNDDNYVVKTLYMLGKGCNMDAFHRAFVEIWKMEASPEVRHFLWRHCTSTLPVKGLLHARHMVDEATCPWCRAEEETVGHDSLIIYELRILGRIVVAYR